MWSADGLTELGFTVASVVPRYLYLRLRATSEAIVITVTADRVARLAQALKPFEEAVLRVEIGNGAELEHTLRFSVDRTTDCAEASDGRDRRVIGVGVQQLMVAARSDARARLAFIEATRMILAEAV